MTVLGHSIPWGTHIGDRHTTDAKGWYAQFKTWLAARKVARQAAKREAAHAHYAGAVSDMVAPSHAHSVAMAFHGFGG